MVTSLGERRVFWRQLATQLPAENSPPVLLTVAETCETLRVSRWSVYQLIRSGKLATIQVGRRRLVPLAAVHALIRAESETA